MPNTQLQLRRGNTAQTAIFTGAVAEVTVDTDKKTLIVHDGLTQGGIEIAKRADLLVSFNAANSAGSYANGAFGVANTATINAAQADQKALSAGSYANGAFAQANTANTYAATAQIHAHAAYHQANTATTDAETAGEYANSAYAKANTAITSLAGYATESYVGTAISNLVDSAPTTLDTLNELAAALGDDANFATTISNMVGVSGGYANSAFAKANTGTTLAQAAFDAANTASSGSSNTLSSGTQTVSLNNSGVITLPASSTLYNNTASLSTNTANQVIDTFSTTSFRTVKYLIQAISGGDVHSTELLLTHNDNLTYTNETSNTSSSVLFNLYSSISGGNVRLNVSPVFETTTIDFVRTAIIARTLSSLEGDFMSLSGTEDLQTGSGTVDLN
jgi:hypothetical protein